MSDETTDRLFQEADELIAALATDDRLKDLPERRTYADFKEFFEQAPVGELKRINVEVWKDTYYLLKPIQVDVYCATPKCSRIMEFDSTTSGGVRVEEDAEFQSVAFDYRCKYCRKLKTFYVYLFRSSPGDLRGRWAIKAGEWPPAGEPLPEALVKLASPQSVRDLLFKGYDCELQGKGIAANAYYRRVVEYRTRALAKKVLDVATLTHAPEEILVNLQQAVKTDSYQRSLEILKESIPGVLITGPDNHFLALHRLVSGGLHKGTDAECLADASEIRLILTHLLGHIDAVIANQAALRIALDKAKERTHRSLPDAGNGAPSDANPANVTDVG